MFVWNLLFFKNKIHLNKYYTCIVVCLIWVLIDIAEGGASEKRGGGGGEGDVGDGRD
ncbi:hypothetical protein QJS04_geneDACA005614 [Acorus gramineus]|uniref:Uncharacterized protein n=1 Tax=Acorus gramineus TaxID=55184 RepID=A0AAV9A4P4_ACOGR|nr:hypothetical protein QJS04_geneDACA005614 [Acorus gramineus]